MGNNITKENANGQITFIGDQNNLFKQSLKNYIYEINGNENLKRGCCLRDNDGDFTLSVPLINDDNKTYTSIEINGTANKQICRFDNNGLQNVNGSLYNPSTKQQEDTGCKKFYTNFCDNVFDQRHLDGHKGTYRNYVNNKKLNWFSDCNCINSNISSVDRKTKSGHKVSPLDTDQYPTELRMPNVFDTFCKDGGDLYLTKPFRRQKDYEDVDRDINVCSQTLKFDNTNIGKDLKLNNVNFKMKCGEQKNNTNTGSKRSTGNDNRNENRNENNEDRNEDRNENNEDRKEKVSPKDIDKKKNRLKEKGSDILSKIDDINDEDPYIETIENKVQDIVDDLNHSTSQYDLDNISNDIDSTIDYINNLPDNKKYNNIINKLENMKKDTKIKKKNYFQNIRDEYNITNTQIGGGLFIFFVVSLFFYIFY